MDPATAHWLLDLLRGSHITFLSAVGVSGDQAVADKLVSLLRAGQFSMLSLFIEWESPDLYHGVIDAIARSPSPSPNLAHNNTLTSVTLQLDPQALSHAVAALTDMGTATHRLEHITVYNHWDEYAYAVSSSVWRLSLIPTLRCLTVYKAHGDTLEPAHTDVLCECLRARAPSNPLAKLSLVYRYFFEVPAWMEHTIMGVKELVAAASPATVVDINIMRH